MSQEAKIKPETQEVSFRNSSGSYHILKLNPPIHPSDLVQALHEVEKRVDINTASLDEHTLIGLIYDTLLVQQNESGS